jgi:hypothetical protein
MFYPIGSNDIELVHFHDWSLRQNPTFGFEDVFSAILNERVDLPKDWEEPIDHFCYRLLSANMDAVKCFLLAYTRVSAPAMWEENFVRYWDNFKDAQKAAKLVQAKLNPGIDYDKQPVGDNRRERTKKKAQNALRTSLRKSPKTS